MPIRAKVSTFRTRPYDPSDLAQMEGEEHKKFASGFYEKVLAEDILEEFESDTVEILGDRIVQLVEANKPLPLILTTSNADELPLKHSFLIKRSYVSDDEKRIFELIVYGPKEPVALKAQMDEAAKSQQTQPLSPSELQEFMQKAIKNMFEEMGKTMASMFSNSAGGPDSRGFNEVWAIQAELQSKRGEFATDEEFSKYFVSEFGKRTDVLRARRKEELIRKPPYYASQMSSMLNDVMTVHCRIIGKDDGLVYKHFEYYKSHNRMSEVVYVLDNGADDGSHVSFVYGKKIDEQKS